MNLSATPVDMVELLQELDDFFHPQCDQANIRCELKIPSEPVKVSADASLLKQAALELMLNAVQVLEGKESANLRLTLTTQDGFAKIQVRDNGPGIEQERLEPIFRPYWSSRRGWHRLRTPGDPADCGGPPR